MGTLTGNAFLTLRTFSPNPNKRLLLLLLRGLLNL
jgi:hypothetical protein